MTAPLLADTMRQRQSLQHAHEWFSRDDPTILITVLSVLGVILIGLVVAALWQRMQDWRLEPERRRPMRLFRRLQRHLGLRWIDRWRLWRLAWRLELPHPAALLISALYFDQCLERLSGADQSPQSMAHYRAIRARLFSES